MQTLSQFNSLQNDTALYNLKSSAKDRIHTLFCSLSLLFLSTKQPDGFLLLWLAVSSSSVCVWSLQCTPWLAVVQGRLLCGWWRVPSGIWTWCRYSSDAAALSPSFLLENQVKVTHARQTSLRALGLAYPSPTFILYSMFLCLSSRQDCLCLRLSAGSALSVTALVSKWMFWNVK